MTVDNTCEYRVDKADTGGSVVVGTGSRSDQVCLLLINDPYGMLLPFCLAPTCSTQSCPIAKFYRGKIDMAKAQQELDELHGDNLG